MQCAVYLRQNTMLCMHALYERAKQDPQAQYKPCTANATTSCTHHNSVEAFIFPESVDVPRTPRQALCRYSCLPELQRLQILPRSGESAIYRFHKYSVALILSASDCSDAEVEGNTHAFSFLVFVRLGLSHFSSRCLLVQVCCKLSS